MYILIDTKSNEVLTDTPLVDERCGLPPNIRKIKADKLPKIPQGKALIFEQKTNTIKEVADLRNAEYTLKDETTTTVDKLFFKLPDGATFDKKPDENHKLKNGVWIIDETLARKSALNKIKNKVAEVRNLVTNNADAITIAVWANKARIAEKVVNKTASEADKVSISTEAQARNKGETVEQLAKIQYEKSQQLSIVSALTDGLESNAISIIEKTAVAKLNETLKKLETNADKKLNSFQSSLDGDKLTSEK